LFDIHHFEQNYAEFLRTSALDIAKTRVIDDVRELCACATRAEYFQALATLEWPAELLRYHQQNKEQIILDQYLLHRRLTLRLVHTDGSYVFPSTQRAEAVHNILKNYDRQRLSAQRKPLDEIIFDNILPSVILQLTEWNKVWFFFFCFFFFCFLSKWLICCDAGDLWASCTIYHRFSAYEEGIISKLSCGDEISEPARHFYRQLECCDPTSYAPRHNSS
jgi:hypothetical protein